MAQKEYGNGAIRVDTYGMANGIVDIVEGENDLLGALSIGMLPAVLMNKMEAQLKDKFPQTGFMCGTEIFFPDEAKDLVSKIMKDVSTDVYKVASERGILRV
jgi:hypothetical protein